MIFGEVFERFVASCPACVMYRALMEYMFAPAKIDGVFQRAAEKQYQRELFFSTLVDLISQVVTRSFPSRCMPPMSRLGLKSACRFRTVV